MKKVKAITFNKGEKIFNLASTTSNDDWIRSARLLKEGKIEELKKLDEEPMYYRSESLLNLIKKQMDK